MTFQTIKNLGLACLVLIMLLVVVIGFRQSVKSVGAARNIIERHMPAQERLQALTLLLNNSAHGLEHYADREHISLEMVSEPLDRMANAIEDFASRERGYRASLASLARAVHIARTQLNRYFNLVEDVGDPNNDTLLKLAKSVGETFLDVRVEMRRLTSKADNYNPIDILDFPLDQLINLLGEAENAFNAFLEQDTTKIDDVVMPIERSLDMLAELEVYGAANNLSTEIENVRTQLIRYRAGLRQYESEEQQSGRSVETLEQLRAQLDSTWAKADEALFALSNLFTQHLRDYQSVVITNGEKEQSAYFLLTVLALGLAGLLSFWLNHILFKRIGVVVEGARRFATMDFSYRLEPSTKDEFGELASALNAMVENIQTKDIRLQSTIRELNEANRAITQANKNLERRVEQRTANLNAAMKKARAANEAKSQFLASMSHEIRTPMNGVLGMAELLSVTNLTSTQQRFLATMRKSGESLLAIINDILDFSKIEAGKLELDETPFDLREVAEDLAEFCAEGAHRKGLELTCCIPTDMPTRFRGDPVRLRQVLMNLIGNAIKFTENGEVAIGAVLVKETADIATVRFEVRDTGIGISPAVQAEIFKAFAQADSSTTRKYGGTGLGLAISTRLINLMGGELELESSVGKGSSFCFSLALVKDARVDETEARRDLRGARVLIVDDNATNREILENHLAGWGLSCQSASDGPQALTLLDAATERSEIFDAAILDFHMPEMNGLELAEAIRRKPRHRDLKLMMLGSLVNEDFDSSSSQAGIALRMTKPVRQSILYDALVSLIVDASQKSEPEPIANPARVPEAGKLGCRVLLVEDNPVNQEVAANMLEVLGCYVAVTGNGYEALDALEQEPYDVILMDCQMPQMDGFKATAEIRQREQQSGAERRTPIIALTANAMEGDRERCLSAGMSDYLCKPFTRAGLQTAVERWLVDEASQPEPRGTMPDPTFASQDSSGSEVGSTAVLNKAALENIRALQRPGRPDVVAKVINMYLDDSPKLLETLSNGVAQRNADAIWKAAHTLKSSSASVGADDFSTMCKDIETLGREGDFQGMAELLDTIERTYPAVCEALVAECNAEAA